MKFYVFLIINYESYQTFEIDSLLTISKQESACWLSRKYTSTKNENPKASPVHTEDIHPNTKPSPVGGSQGKTSLYAYTRWMTSCIIKFYFTMSL